LEKININNANNFCLIYDKQNDEKKLRNSIINNTNNSTIDTNDFYKKIEILANDLKKEINKHTIISFDIFDTLLVRPYYKPKDLFFHLEKLHNIPGFQKERIQAERKARKNNRKMKKEDSTTFDEIYKHIKPEYVWLKEKELSLEYNLIKARPLLKEIYDYAKQQQKKVIIISDMYLSKNFLTDVLKKCGYDNFDKLFVSSEYKKTKNSGSLFKQAIMELNISTNDILHIGDNINCDIKSASKLGIDVFYVPKVINLLFESDTRVGLFYNQHKNDLGVSIMLGLLATNIENTYKNYWFGFGYKYGGPVILGFMQWFDKQVKNDNIKEVLFIGRDGYTLKKVFNLIKTSKPQNYYINLSRKIASKFYSKNENISQKAIKEYNLYLEQFDLKDKKIAMVDSDTFSFTAQKALTFLLPNKVIKGYYFLCKPHNKMAYLSYKKEPRFKAGGTLIDLLELIMTAPTPPVKAIENGKPVFEIADNIEQTIIDLYPDLSSGIIAFTKEYINRFNKLNSYISCEILIDWLKKFYSMPSERDKKMFFKVQHAGDENHSKYHVIFKDWYK